MDGVELSVILKSLNEFANNLLFNDRCKPQQVWISTIISENDKISENTFVIALQRGIMVVFFQKLIHMSP